MSAARSERNGKRPEVRSCSPIDGAAHSSIEDEQAVYQVRGLAHCDVLLNLLTAQRARRQQHDKSPAQTSAAAHLREYAHELRFGCCA